MPPKPPAPRHRSGSGAPESAARRPQRKPKPASAADAAGVTAGGGDRIAKVLARSGIASRRDAEKMVLAGRVAVNGQQLASPAVNVTPSDRVTVDGKALPRAQQPRLWLYHKPAGLVTTARDEQGRPTVFDALPADMPRVMPVGRLDLTSEGLLLLTNDGELKRRLELPSTGWLRKYRVRVHGTPGEAQLAPLKTGLVIEGERFQPMIVGIDRQQGSNAWLTVGLREGRNREVRRAMEAVGLTVNRLIRVSYGPFQLGDLATGDVKELRAQVLRDQLGIEISSEPEGKPVVKPVVEPAGRPVARPGTKAAPGSAAKPAPEGAGGKAKHASWGMKSHGGSKPGAGKPRGGQAADTAEASGKSGARPRSWGSKSHQGGHSTARPTGPRR